MRREDRDEAERLDGVDATVNLATEQATVRRDPPVPVDALIEAVESAGYRARPAAAREDHGHAHDHDERQDALQLRLGVAIALTVPVALLAMVPSLQFSGWKWVAFALATPVVFWSGFAFHRAAPKSVRRLGATVDTLISIGTLAAWVWSTVVLLAALDADTYFEVAAVITTLILLGRYLETRAKGRSGQAIRGLLELGAKEARVLRDGRELVVLVAELRVGDEFAVRPGEKLATDGVVLHGESAIDQSLLTGEPGPVEGLAGSEVTGATVNSYGHLVVRATTVGRDRALAQIDVSSRKSSRARLRFSDSPTVSRAFSSRW